MCYAKPAICPGTDIGDSATNCYQIVHDGTSYPDVSSPLLGAVPKISDIHFGHVTANISKTVTRSINVNYSSSSTSARLAAQMSTTARAQHQLDSQHKCQLQLELNISSTRSINVHYSSSSTSARLAAYMSTTARAQHQLDSQHKCQLQLELNISSTRSINVNYS